MLKPITIGKHKINHPVFLAPMSGVSDLPFRQLAARYGAGLVFTEMIACEALTKKNSDMLRRLKGKHVGLHAVQLAGREPYWMGEGARIAEANGADILDINMGCPARKVTNGYSGSALMRNPDHALSLIEATVNATSLPVCLKMRLGWDENQLNAPEIAKRAESSGIQMITVHGRTRCQFYKGKANWAAIAHVSHCVNIPVIANGDFIELGQVDDILLQSDADGIMIGRGAYGRPWFPGFVAGHACECAQPKNLLSFTEKKLLIFEHYEAMLMHYGIEHGVRIARKHLKWYFDEIGDVSKWLYQKMLTEIDPLKVINLLKSELSEFIIRGYND